MNNKMLRPLMVMAAVALVAACSPKKLDEVKALNDASGSGNAFTQALTTEYKNFVNSELDTYEDHADSLHFSRKGLAAARGDMVMPEPVSDWNVLPGHAEELINSRARLVNVFALGAREMQPQLSAVAQARFDCWIEEQEENFQQNNISACKSDFMNALAQLESAMPPPPLPAPEPEPMVVDDGLGIDPSEPMAIENAKYIVFFDFDESTLNAGANSILDAAAQEAISRNLNGVMVVGHTDTSGSNAYNERLSMQRATAVRDALIQRGVNAGIIMTQNRGENELLVDTADGVREPANRRAEITFQ
jgi:OOP family OmpA-OmpF porin